MCGMVGFKVVPGKQISTFHPRKRGKLTTIALSWANFRLSKHSLMCSTLNDTFGSDHQAPQMKITDEQAFLPCFRNTCYLENLKKHDFVDTVETQLSSLPIKVSSNEDVAEKVNLITHSLVEALTCQGKMVLDNVHRRKRWWDDEKLRPLIKIQNRARSDDTGMFFPAQAEGNMAFEAFASTVSTLGGTLATYANSAFKIIHPFPTHPWDEPLGTITNIENPRSKAVKVVMTQVEQLQQDGVEVRFTNGSFMEKVGASIVAVVAQYTRMIIDLYWAPGYEGILLNEKADAEAKKAIEEDEEHVHLERAGSRYLSIKIRAQPTPKLPQSLCESTPKTLESPTKGQSCDGLEKRHEATRHTLQLSNI
ncbi:hypothetical protein CROQUDRAFT_105835 [Cronartium quercuum f. sp. fusiforme G11]|uniref:Uncharacterized protein n=1 Tax=Cronartium quercuum f. sp. fusiforme G11 TaxID=708437 RepID=A0A9P6TE16_9BASI|nr:hypothetical protein CROQUDRAFT_105835 [Cronartium quercuum f. sp. fusiforme G11]